MRSRVTVQQNQRVNLLNLIYLITALIWIPIEGGRLWLITGFGWMTTFYIVYSLFARLSQSNRLRGDGRWPFIIRIAGMGLGVGCLSVPVTLGLMALKTGLHNHGPEYTPAQINFVLDQWVNWPILGLLIGLGLGMILAALRDRLRFA